MTPLLPPASRAAWSHLLRASIDVSLRTTGMEATQAVLASLNTAPTLDEYPRLEAPRTTESEPSYVVRIGGRWADVSDDEEA